MLDNQKIQNNWTQIKSQVLSKWNKLSEAEVEKTQGNKNSLSKLVQNKYGSISDFDKTYERICESSIPSSRKNLTANTSAPQSMNSGTGVQAQADGRTDIEERSATAPSAEAGLEEAGTEQADTLKAGSPERKLNANYAKVEHGHDLHGDADEENYEEDYKLDTDKNTQFTTPDEFSPTQDPSPSREDITLGRSISSAPTKSTAKAAPISSEVSSNDAKKKL